MTLRTSFRSQALIRRATALSVVAALGWTLSPVSAHASETLSATGNGWAVDASTALANAEADAYGNLYELALSRGESCTNVTYTTIGYYQIPGAPYGFAYQERATGTCS
ncbi:hypothetical protein KGA66_20530 [Actinocrinis puniceicyclus]|uniref:Uncharacterized protein n=1 Tax=Actinocrinis puniceicyclus TaxID=977794 RepID=A0A8J7WRP5_9ACTN|nr:hypothetical protein [Actinocrinis puniceicyclus]MBS2965450.1 hypothetical protein [Actinocrinis puniceicyclus]